MCLKKIAGLEKQQTFKYNVIQVITVILQHSFPRTQSIRQRSVIQGTRFRERVEQSREGRRVKKIFVTELTGHLYI